MATHEIAREPARDIPVFRRCDVLVAGGGPAGCAAAAAAAQTGAETILVERYGHLGGMSTGGFVLFIANMTDWNGNQVIAGFANDILGHLPKDAILGPPKEIWGSKDPQQVQYWTERHASEHKTVIWSPTIDPELMKNAYNDLLLERGVKLLLHAWAVAPIMEGNEMRGVIFESKSGRQAILAKTIIDATGDGDIFALAGAPIETDVIAEDTHNTMNLAFRWGGVDLERYLKFRRDHKDEFDAIMAKGAQMGIREHPCPMPRNDEVYFMGPRLFGYSPINVEDLTALEIESRQLMMKLLDFYRNNMPGFEGAWIIDTASQMGTRHSRRLVGRKKVRREDWLAGKVHEDEIGVSPSRGPDIPSVSIPYGCLVPERLHNLLAAGRTLSCDPATHTFLRLIPQCWVMGQAAGTAAAVAANAGIKVRDVNVKEVQRQLAKQGVYLHEPVVAALAEPPSPQPQR